MPRRKKRDRSDQEKTSKSKNKGKIISYGVTTRVQSYSQLIRDFADHDNFLACGEEMVPLEMAGGNNNNRRGGHGASESVDGSSRPGGKRNTRSDIYQDRDLSPGRSSDYTAIRGQGQGQSKARRRKTDSVRVDINGKTRGRNAGKVAPADFPSRQSLDAAMMDSPE
ncbi:hypothetical protein ElyMa_005572500 [Elysia marginata]|uniref:Uncharacterized protein n=1 Tax=Elysia marginata TaxID=1093978 RepID=A0AAV4F2J7_9GAST|nr:hypothetical protein ElyMa_005572500 [Elysia marginata]